MHGLKFVRVHKHNTMPYVTLLLSLPIYIPLFPTLNGVITGIGITFKRTCKNQPEQKT